MPLHLAEHPEATAELLEAIRYYHDREPGLGDDFDAEAHRAVRDAAGEPEAWPKFAGWDRQPVVRSRRVNGFPYRVVYFVRGDELVIVAYAHQKRRPGYWRDRVGG